MKTFVISIGGSIIVPDEIDYKFLNNLKKVILKYSKKNKIIICTGGGHTARAYINALKKENLPRLEQDLLGIECTRLNAHLLSFFLNLKHKIPSSLKEIKLLSKSSNIVITGGLEPGTTSDGTTAKVAKFLKAEAMINMTNVKGLYNKDPRKFKDAKFIPQITHNDFDMLLSRVRQESGQHFVLDALAAKITKESKIRVYIIQGIANLEKILSEKMPIGTIIT
ncbi:UMP kinase [Candidatus Woesearchaeota archaeon]|nr:UMP kinase [Candidatus Woesearchaeota archaeon]